METTEDLLLYARAAKRSKDVTQVHVPDGQQYFGIINAA